MMTPLLCFCLNASALVCFVLRNFWIMGTKKIVNQLCFSNKVSWCSFVLYKCMSSKVFVNGIPEHILTI